MTRERSSAAVSEGTVYTYVEGKDDQLGHLTALEAKSGEFKTRFFPGSGVTSSPVVAGGTVYLGTKDYLYAFDSKDAGTIRSRFDANGAVENSPVVLGKTVYISTANGYVYALE